MKKVLLSIVLLLLAGAAQATTTHAFKWIHFGADPAYASRAKAMADRANVFRKFGYTKAQVACLVRATARPPNRIVNLKPGDRLLHMESGRGVVHPNTVIAFQRIVRGVYPFAQAEEWTAQCGGETITVDLPRVCNNWSDRVLPKPKTLAIAVPECAKVHLTVPAGRERTLRFTTVRRAPIQSFNCWGVIERQWRTGAPRNCDWCDWGAVFLGRMEHTYGGTFNYFHTSLYRLHEDVTASGSMLPTKVTLVFPRAVMKGGLGLCVEVDGRLYPTAEVFPSFWKGSQITIPANYWNHPRVLP